MALLGDLRGRQMRGVGNMGRSFSKLALALLILATILATGGHVATDLVVTLYALPECAPGPWEQGEGTADLTIYSMASHPESPNVYAGTWGDPWGEGVYRALSGENSWYQAPELGFPFNIASLAIDPASPSTVYAGTKGNGIFRSANGGDSWGATTGLEGKEVWSLAVTSADPIYAYAGTAGEIYTSTNGINWILAGGAEIGTEKFYALAVDPQDSRIAYVGTKGKGVYRTTNGGIDWTSRGLATMTVRALAIHPHDSRIIYAGTEFHGIFKSTDEGVSWPVNGLAGRAVMAVVINPRNPGFVYAGTYGDGVWVSYNGGYDWHRMPGLTDGANYIYSLTLFTPAGEDDCQILYAGTTDGVWARYVTPLCTLYLPLVDKGYPAGQ